jgi:hypothetical protein
MTTLAILPISDANGEKSYRATSRDKHSVGKTVGQALDAHIPQVATSDSVVYQHYTWTKLLSI